MLDAFINLKSSEFMNRANKANKKPPRNDSEFSHHRRGRRYFQNFIETLVDENDNLLEYLLKSQEKTEADLFDSQGAISHIIRCSSSWSRLKSLAPKCLDAWQNLPRSLHPLISLRLRRQLRFLKLRNATIAIWRFKTLMYDINSYHDHHLFFTYIPNIFLRRLTSCRRRKGRSCRETNGMISLAEEARNFFDL